MKEDLLTQLSELVTQDLTCSRKDEFETIRSKYEAIPADNTETESTDKVDEQFNVLLNQYSERLQGSNLTIEEEVEKVEEKPPSTSAEDLVDEVPNEKQEIPNPVEEESLPVSVTIEENSENQQDEVQKPVEEVEKTDEPIAEVIQEADSESTDETPVLEDAEVSSEEDQTETDKQAEEAEPPAKTRIPLPANPQEKAHRIRLKDQLIESIVELTKSDFTIGQAFSKLKALETTWRSIGSAGGSEERTLIQAFSHEKDKLFYKINIQKDLRKIDHKKNYEIKANLIKSTEALMENPSISKVEALLKNYEYQWSNTGHVDREDNKELWKQFRKATRQIYQKIRNHFESQTEEMNEHLKKKIVLCEEINHINTIEVKKAKLWRVKTEEVQKIQSDWKKIGYSTENDQIWSVFRSACDKFFDRKRAFFGEQEEVYKANKIKKESLCEKAEAVAGNTDWRQTTEFLIQLQKEWKTIGPMQPRFENGTWKRFRTACDKFFEEKKQFYGSMDSRKEDNYKSKIALLEQFAEIKLSGEVDNDRDQLKGMVAAWNEIGEVPNNKRDNLNNRYNKILDEKFNATGLSEEKGDDLQFQLKIEAYAAAVNGHIKLQKEIEFLDTKIERMMDEIHQYENNLGFFGKANKDHPIRVEVENKIAVYREKVDALEKKKDIIKKIERQSRENQSVPEKEA